MPPKKTLQAAKVAGKNGFSLISDKTFRNLYADLLRCKMLDERLRIEPSYEQWSGREACTAGVAACLHSGDSIIPTPRSLLAGYLQHGSLRFMRVSAPTPIQQLAAAVSDAMRHKVESRGNVAVVFAGSSKPKRMRESFARAAKQSLPVFYVLQSDAPFAGDYGNIPLIRVDGSDAVAIYRVAHESIKRAREGLGPTIMECVAWSDEKEPKDPFKKLEEYLVDKKLFRKHWSQQLEKKYEGPLNEAVKGFRTERIGN
jgi:TPP-dependent pyruvate/acetoin dehydrogenase alpha subunit